MPRWQQHSRNWFGYRSRLNLRNRFGEILDGIIPTVVFDRVWHREYLDDRFGAWGQSWDVAIEGDAGNGADNYHCIALHNPSADSLAAQERGPIECLVYRAWGMLATVQTNQWTGTKNRASYTPATGACFLSTPPEGFWTAGTMTRSAANVVGVRYGWMTPGVGPTLDEVRLPRAHVDCGMSTVLPIISVGGINNFAVGPLFPPGAGGALRRGMHADFVATRDTPPIRVKPGQRLMIANYQTVAAVGLNNQLCVVGGFDWIERPYEE